MSDAGTIEILLDGQPVQAAAGATLWDVARAQGIDLPHLCHLPSGGDAPALRPVGNCCACVVEVDGEAQLAASCCRTVAAGMSVQTASERAARARRLVVELLLADAGTRSAVLAPDSELAAAARALGLGGSRFAPRAAGSAPPDLSHPDIGVELDACIQCTRCVRVCREVAGHKVIGLAHHGDGTRIVFDAEVPIGDSSCVSCLDCVRVCPTGALSRV